MPIQLEHELILSHKTVLKHTERISALFNWAIKQGYISENVFRGKLEPIRKTEKIDEIWAINFNADSEDQSVKTEVGN